MSCPECGAEKGHNFGCSKDEVLGGVKSFAPPDLPQQGPRSHGLIPGVNVADMATDDDSWEFKFRLAAIPASLVLAALFHMTAMGPILLRNFFGMWLHELGHASAAWVCGRFALPVPWMTYASEERSVPVTVVMISLGVVGAWWFSRRRWWVPAIGCAFLAVLTIACTAFMKPLAVEAFGIFAGDAGAMVYGVMLMATFYARRDSSLVQGALRWGFVWWGAAAFVDSWANWVASRRNWANIPFGVEEVGGQDVLSDPTKLVDHHGWSETQLVNRYFYLGIVCLVITACVYVWGLLSVKRSARAA